VCRYQKDASISTQLTWEFWFLSTSVLEKLALLSLSEHTEHVKTTTDYVTTVFNFDQSFLKASQNVDSCPDKILLKEFLNHYEGQVNFHFSVLAFKQAKKDLINFKEVSLYYFTFLYVYSVIVDFRWRILFYPFCSLLTTFQCQTLKVFGLVICRQIGGYWLLDGIKKQHSGNSH